MRVLLLHAYSASNAGDGLLVNESLRLIREALGADTEVTITALHPRTFGGVDARIVDASARPGRRKALRGVLREIDAFDAVFGVGGGYLRAGRPVEALKTALAHGPQLKAALRYRGPVLYLPQSVGPFRVDPGGALRRRIQNVDTLFLRDERSLSEAKPTGALRVPDLALLAPGWRERGDGEVFNRPVISVRHVDGQLPRGVFKLVSHFAEYDGYVQSVGAGNDDTRAVEEIGAKDILPREELLDSPKRRVVVAVRLHAALMALRAGHWVVHLAYERKGFGAFQDLGLPEYVHNVRSFDSDRVADQVGRLLSDEAARAAYDDRVTSATKVFATKRQEVIDVIRARVLPV